MSGTGNLDIEVTAWLSSSRAQPYCLQINVITHPINGGTDDPGVLVRTAESQIPTSGANRGVLKYLQILNEIAHRHTKNWWWCRWWCWFLSKRNDPFDIGVQNCDVRWNLLVCRSCTLHEEGGRHHCSPNPSTRLWSLCRESTPHESTPDSDVEANLSDWKTSTPTPGGKAAHPPLPAPSALCRTPCPTL